jgi:hypothetical protein
MPPGCTLPRRLSFYGRSGEGNFEFEFRITGKGERVAVWVMANKAATTKRKSKTKSASKTKSKTTGSKKRSSKKGVVAKIASSIVSTVASVIPSGSKKSKGKKKR